MTNTIINHFKKKVIALFFFLTISISSSFAQVTISSTVNWDPSNPPPTSYSNGITITSTGKLTINSLSLNFNGGKGISVNAGGFLNCTNTNLLPQYPNDYSQIWTGINAIGDQSLNQYQTLPDPNTLNDPNAWKGTFNNSQTIISVNNCTLEQAENAIKSDLGAILEIRNTNFNNNYRSVTISNYIAPNHKDINASVIMDCTFKWNQDNENILNFNSINHAELSLIQVKAIRIGGCDFINDDFSQTCELTHGIGILANQSSFSVSKSGDVFCLDDKNCLENCNQSGIVAGNNFINMSFGIKFIDVIPSLNTMVIRHSKYSNTAYSIYSENGQNNIIANCIFNCNYSFMQNKFDFGCSNLSYGPINIKSNGSVGIKILENQFEYNRNKNITFIHVDAPGFQKSELKANKMEITDPGSISNDYAIGMLISGPNQGIEIFCNEFKNIGTDIHIASSSVSQFLGTDQTHAGMNNFSLPISTRYNIVDNNSLNGYYYLNNSATGNWIPTNDPILFFPKTPVSNSNNLTNCNILCSQYNNTADLNLIEINNLPTLFPNPVENELVIKSNNRLNNYKIYNQAGALVLESQLNVPLNEIKIPLSIKSGFYCILVQDNTMQYHTLKFIKK